VVWRQPLLSNVSRTLRAFGALAFYCLVSY
jgi:hypothetical protein